MSRAFGRIAILLLVARIAAAADFPGPELPNPERDLHLTMGVQSFEVGDFESAYVHFEKARLAAPRDRDVLLYLVQTSINLKRMDRAEAHLGTLLAADPNDGEALFFLGYIQYLEARYREALLTFDRAASNGCRVPTVVYFQGACLFRLGEYERARPALEKAIENLPASRSESRFYLGASEFALARYGEAVDELEAVVDAEGDTRLGRAAADLLMEARRRADSENWYEIDLNAGGAYDSNVLYEPEGDIVPNRDGFYGFGALDAVVYPYRAPESHVGVGGHYYQSVHTDRGDRLIRDYDLSRAAGSLDVMGRIAGMRRALFLDAYYEYSTAALGDETFQNTHELIPSATLVESPAWATRVQFTMQWKDFPDFSGRDATYWQPAIAQVFPLPGSPGQIGAQVGFEQNESDSDYYDYQGLLLFTGAVFPIAGNWSGNAALQWRYLDYVYHPDHRVDRRLTGDLGVRYEFSDHVAGLLGFRHTRNDSLAIYSWEKNVTSLSAAVTF